MAFIYGEVFKVLPSSRTAKRSSSSSHSTVKRFSTKNPRVFLLHRTARGFLEVPGFKRSITYLFIFVYFHIFTIVLITKFTIKKFAFSYD